MSQSICGSGLWAQISRVLIQVLDGAVVSPEAQGAHLLIISPDVGSIQLLPEFWTEGLHFLLVVSWWLPSCSCHIAAHSLGTCFFKAIKRASSDRSSYNFMGLITCTQSPTSDHLCCIPLVRRNLQVTPALKGEEYTGREHWKAAELAVTPEKHAPPTISHVIWALQLLWSKFQAFPFTYIPHLVSQQIQLMLLWDGAQNVTVLHLL